MKITTDLIVKNSYERKARDETVDNFLGRLTHVSLVNNGIKEIENVERCRNATVLYMYDNAITHISGLSKLTNLTQLYLQNNKIEKIEGLDQLTNLTTLHLGNNRIKHIENLNLPLLTTLKLDYQKIPEDEYMTFDEECIKNLSDNLTTLTLSGNRIQYVSSLRHLKKLETLDLSNNLIFNWEDVKIMLKGFENLLNLNLISNPVSVKGLKFRQKVVYACKKLEVFNHKEITDIEKQYVIKMAQSNRLIEKRKKEELLKKQNSMSSDISDFSTSTNSSNISLGLSKNSSNDSLNTKIYPHMPPYYSQYRDLYLLNKKRNEKNNEYFQKSFNNKTYNRSNSSRFL
ncbi:outer arm dynein light chain 1 [Anaeromyces robustus]|uniref:Outer arm dynein light chain 1 n=1 Tax=Anaeromyces robustus TaxID=1754192 RepID=A0A1Y1WY02_9FUNG|nr:outer arm dynein light chain 1 [Anaeromyces robustus]|eukprot:ORX78393.1 outer arm dynein light chain 1 [Anaeromyces robustus]